MFNKLKQVGYPFVIGLLTASIYGVNASPKLIVCSLFFVLSLAFSTYIHEAWGKGKQKTAILTSVGINLAFLFYAFQWMVIFSMIALLPAFYVARDALNLMRTKQPFAWALFLSFVSAILVDGLLIALWEYGHFGSDKIVGIVSKSLFYKTIYAGLVSLAVHTYLVYQGKRSIITKE